MLGQTGPLTVGGSHAGLYVVSFLVPLVATFLLTPVAARLAHRYEVIDHPHERKHHETATPYLGGVAVAAGLVLIGLVAAASSAQLLTILLCGIALLVVGLVDDRFDVGPVVKLGVEVGAALGLWLAGVRAGFFGTIWLDLPLTILWIVAVTNAVNMVDNMDGVSSGLVAIAALTFFAIAADRGEFLVAAFAVALAGASLGFLRHNFPPASIFLGDAGTLFLGFLLAALALKLDMIEQAGPVRAAAPLLIVGVALLDMVVVVVARIREGRPIYVGGTDHSSHRLTHRGWSGHAVVITMYAAQLVMSCAALFIVYASETWALIAVIGAAIVAAALLVALLSLAHAGSSIAPDFPVDSNP